MKKRGGRWKKKLVLEGKELELIKTLHKMGAHGVEGIDLNLSLS